MADFKALADRRKQKENKYVMEAERIKIEKGMISYDENILIPLSAISFVEIPEQEKTGQDVHELKIQNHAGTYFYITAPDLDFIKEIRNALMICFNDRNAVYSGMERSTVIDGDKICTDKITTTEDIHSDSMKHSEAAVPEKKNTDNTAAIPILDDEWNTLKDYSLKRMKDFPEKERKYTICEAMAAAAALKNREKCKRILEVSGNDALDIIISGAPIAVKAIVNKLM